VIEPKTAGRLLPHLMRRLTEVPQPRRPAQERV